MVFYLKNLPQQQVSTHSTLSEKCLITGTALNLCLCSCIDLFSTLHKICFWYDIITFLTTERVCCSTVAIQKVLHRAKKMWSQKHFICKLSLFHSGCCTGDSLSASTCCRIIRWFRNFGGKNCLLIYGKWISFMPILKWLTLRQLMSYIYIYRAPILDVSRSHTTTQHSR